MGYFPINIKTEYSLLNSLIRIPELIAYAKECGYHTLAITDTNMYGVMEFIKECTKHDIKPIVGLEVSVDHYPIYLYAQNEEGYHNLTKLTTIASKNPLSLEEMTHYSSNLVAIVPYEGMPYYDIYNKIYKHLFKGYSSEEQRKELKGDNLIYARSIHYLKEEEKEYFPYLLAIQKGVRVKDIVTDSLSHAMLKPNQDIENFEKLNSLCHLTLTKQKDLLPIYECPEGYDAFSYMKEICKQGLKKLFGTLAPKKYIERLKYELDIIHRMGYDNYFLIVWDYIHYAKENGILVGPGRGSAAGSLVSYLMGITNIDPIKYDLLFERFLNPERVSMPDIDVDFEFHRREEVIQYCTKKYGLKNVAGIITFGTLASKQVIRDVGKCLEINLKVIDVICKMLDSKATLMENYQNNEKLRNYLKMEPELMKMYKIGMKLEGLKRHSSVHAAGIVMCKEPLDHLIPLDFNHEGFYTTAYSMEYLEELGLLKMDFLALRNLTIISTILEDLKKNHVADLDFECIPLNDEKAIQIFTNVNTVGIFQFESVGMMNFIRKLKPSSFEDVAAALALFRPGPMNNIDHYIKRKKGLEPIDYIHPNLEGILKPTYGIMIYQEQIMQVANVMAGYSLGEADILRKAISKKKEDVMLQEQEQFIKRSMERGYSKDVSTKVYELILKFASYGFNKAHSVAYAMISYRMAYLKAHYPNYFLKALLSMVIGSEIKTKEYVYECKLNKIELLKPDINLSDKDYTLSEFGIRYPLSGIKNLGNSTVSSILEERKKGPFQDIYDFIKRCYGKCINRKTLESLIAAGCFRSFGLNKHTLDHNLDNLINYGDLVKDLNEDFFDKPELELVEEYSKQELMAKELEVFGFYLSNHPVTEAKVKYPNSISIQELENYFDKVVQVVLYVDRIKEVSTKKNDKMCFITGSDELNVADVVVFPKQYQKYDQLKVGDVLLVTAKVEKRYDKLQLVASDLLRIKDGES